MTDPITAGLTELVRKHHYSRDDFQVDTVNAIIYNVCPLCGSVDHSETRPPKEGEQPGISITRVVSNCNFCVQMKFLHPQIFTWATQIYNNMALLSSLQQGAQQSTFVNSDQDASEENADEETDEYIN